MPTFRGKVLHDGRLVADRVTGHYEVAVSASPPAWSGSFTSEFGDIYQHLRDLLTLQLDDGRRGRLTVRKIDSTTDVHVAAVQFQGVGPPPQ